ncbi:MAG TPA: hypothetical protein PKA90_03330 [Ignavibacteria bacterium]|nr:hypothetical protein [Ignavibacteria bacterium]HMR39441.1 hypothetical protein [Ignavibacteria bacterium]
MSGLVGTTSFIFIPKYSYFKMVFTFYSLSGGPEEPGFIIITTMSGIALILSYSCKLLHLITEPENLSFKNVRKQKTTASDSPA